MNISTRDLEQLHLSHGIVARCDPATKELIKFLDNSRQLGCSFIIADLDDNTLFLDAKKVPDLVDKLEQRREDL
uniref:General transcription and DNA repair factor IIH subunit TFB5 n=1 Tax=Panagrolaimus sp. JU765 TaxID=591449 RepID=A0AC34Q2B4_9BILA